MKVKSISERRGWGAREGISVVQTESGVSDNGRMKIIRLIKRHTERLRTRKRVHAKGEPPAYF